MNDWNTEVAGQYELNVESMRKGRGAWIFETDRGLKLLKEYRGSVKRLEFEELVLGAVAGAGSLRVDQYVRNKEGELLSTASDGIRYVVKDWFSDRECDLKDTGEILSAVRQIAVLHKLLRKMEPREEWNMKSMVSPPLFMAMEKHNWDIRLGQEMFAAYDRIMPLSMEKIESLYYLVLYPEKYWKQLNFYYNSKKAWFPARNMEKIRILMEQAENQKNFLELLQ